MHKDIAKVVLHPDKPNSVLDVFLAPEDMADKSNLGQFFMLVEINSRERGMKEKVKEMVDMTVGDYYSSPVPDTESSLETTCQNLNLNLTSIFEKPDVWYKKINILVGVMKDDFLALACYGKFSAYLVRKNKISKILDSEECQGDAKNNFFSQLTTGEVHELDALIISNYALFDFFSLEKIKEVVGKLKAEQAAQQFKNLIGENVRKPNLLSLFVKCEADRLEKVNVNAQTSNYLKELYGSQESMRQLQNLEQRTGRTLGASLLSGKEMLVKIIKALNFKNKKNKATSKKELSLPGVKKEKQKTEKPAHDDKVSVIKADTGKRIKNMSSLIKDNVSRLKMPNFKSGKFILPVALLIIIFMGSLIYMGYNRGQSEKIENYNNLMSEIQDKQEEAEASLIYQDKEKADRLLREALQILDDNQFDKPEQQTEADHQRGVITKLINRINNIFEVEPQVMVNLTDKNIMPSQLLKDANNFYVLDSASKLYKVNEIQNDINQVFEASNIKQVASWKDDGEFILFRNDNQFYYRTVGGEDVLNVALAEGAQVADFKIYGDRIYYLDNNTPAIYKISGPLQTNPQISVWTQADKDILSNASQMVIDGNIWLVNQDKIIKMFGGKRVEFNLSKLDKDLGNDLEIYTEIDWDYIYVLDKNNSRLLKIDKQGILQAQFLHSDLSQANDLVVDNNQKNAWLISNGQVVRIDMSE